MNISTDSKIEALLFFIGEPVKLSRLKKLFDLSDSDLTNSLKALEMRLVNSGLSLIQNGDEVQLGTKPEMSEIIEKITKEELSRDLGRAGLETISIVLYKNPISRREIDYIRGVNSSFILRNLLIRGLVERIDSIGKERGYLYKPTTELMSFMGLTKMEELPEYARVLNELQEFSKNDVIETTKETENE